MHTEAQGVYAKDWDEVRGQLEHAPIGASVRVALADIGHPRDEGALKDVGLPVGQLADWRFPALADRSGLHVHEHATYWEAHIDRVHPASSLLGHVQHDVPQLLVVGGAAFGAALAVKSGGGLLGVALGLVVGGVVGTMLTR